MLGQTDGQSCSAVGFSPPSGSNEHGEAHGTAVSDLAAHMVTEEVLVRSAVSSALPPTPIAFPFSHSLLASLLCILPQLGCCLQELDFSIWVLQHGMTPKRV